MATLGHTLREARERRGLSLTEVALETNIQSPRLDAIEHDDFSRLPPPVYVKGFIRTYAKYLDLDPDPLVQEYEARHAPREAAPSMKPEEPSRSQGQGQPKGGSGGPSAWKQFTRSINRIPTRRIVSVAAVVCIAGLAVFGVGRLFKRILDREPAPVETLAPVSSTLVKLPPEPYFSVK